jgi:hypothetical protein
LPPALPFSPGRTRKFSNAFAFINILGDLFGAEKFDECCAKPTKRRVVVITFVPVNANVERRNGYR